MYKTFRDTERFEFLNVLANQYEIPDLTDSQIAAIKETNLLAIHEKIQLFALSSQIKLTTEVSSYINYSKRKENDFLVASTSDIQKLEAFLKELPFPFYIDSILRTSKKTMQKTEITWVQITANTRVLEFMKRFGNDLTSMEVGILYGYPSASIAAFSGLIEKVERPSESYAHRYLGGVLSTRFRKYELAWLQSMWDELDSKFNISDLLKD